MGKLKKRILFIIVFIVASLAIVIPRSFKRVAAPHIILRPQDALETVLATGRIVGEKTIPLSFIRAGRIAEELVLDGDRVKVGQPLMHQESAIEETALAQRRAALSVARINLEKLQTVDIRDAQQKVRQAQATASYASDYFERQSGLFAQKSIPQLQYDQAKRDKELAEAALEAALNQFRSLETALKSLAELQVAQAENDVRRAEIDLRDIVLRAPFDGQVVEHIAHKGEFVNPGQRIITFIPAAPRTYVEIQVDEANVGKLSLKQKAAVTSAAFPGRTFPAVIERIASIVDAQRGTFAVRLMMDAYKPELLPESSVSVQIVIGEASGALLLEQRFVIREGALTFAYAESKGRAKRVTLAVRDLGNGLFGIVSGLKAGEKVLLPQGLKDGARIKLVPLTQ